MVILKNKLVTSELAIIQHGYIFFPNRIQNNNVVGFHHLITFSYYHNLGFLRCSLFDLGFSCRHTIIEKNVWTSISATFHFNPI